MTCASLQVHIAYVPVQKHSVPSEQLKALVKTCSRRLQIQERLTQEIADGVDSLTGRHLTVLLHLRLIGWAALGYIHSKAGYSTSRPVAELILSARMLWHLPTADWPFVLCMLHPASCGLIGFLRTKEAPMPFCRRRRRSCCMRGVSYVHGGSWSGKACQQHHHYCCAGGLPAAHSTASRHAAASHAVPG